ncbi:MAG: ABC transporter permease subunit, partial [Bacillota bacterium]
DATRIDGLSKWQTYWIVMLPMALPAIYTVVILQTVYIWNEFLFALVFIRTPELFTLPRALVTFKGTFITSFGPLNAAVILSAVPTIIIYSIFSDRIRRGMSMGFSAKG